jgi:single-stranded-DNA-specific exonuclease
LEKRWQIGGLKGLQETQHLQESLKVDRVIACLLQSRGISSFEDAKNFFRPDLKLLHDPFLMKGMRVAIERIQQAIEDKEKVLIYGDYDVDGTTAVSIVYSFFKTYIDDIRYYIPDRYKEGYGISFASIDYAAENGYSLVIALDCGIKAVDKIAYANEKKVDFIICDHHLPGSELPAAVAVLDQKQSDCPYPYKELSGAGIGFKLIQAFAMEEGISQEKCYDYLDLVATSIAADIVPITGENRVMAYYGLEKINLSPRPGIQALLNIQQQKTTANINTLVFTLGPRINAAGRIEHGSKAVELLICEDADQANEFALAINDTNTQRRDLDMGTTVEALEMLEKDPLTPNRRSTVLFNESWHKGVIGIVASRLIEKYYRPTIVLTESDGKVTGSARSVREFDVYSAIEKCNDLLEQFGGHKFAAGLSLKKENVAAFRARFEEAVTGSITEDQLTPRIDVDIEIEFHEITEKFLRILRQFAPHGPENMSPIFITRSVFDTGWGQVFGNNHLKLELFQKSNPNARFRAIAFEKGDYINFFQSKRPMDIVYKIQETESNGKITIQLVIEDLRLSTEE